MGDSNSSEAALSEWIERLARGESEALSRLWTICFERAKRFADRRLPKGRRRDADEEDVAASALHSLFRGAREGRFTRLAHRDELWKLLATLTARKLSAQAAKQLAIKRGQGLVRGESALTAGRRADSGEDGFARAPDDGMAPEVIVQMRDMLENLMDKLGDETLKHIARAKIDGASNEDLAEALHVSLRSIERKLSIIRSHWCELLDPKN